MVGIKYRKQNRGIFWAKDEGFSTLGVVVALLLTLGLIFSTAQVYRVSSASADIQNVADSSALAAENQVAEFMICVRVCDSVVLSLSLGSIVVTALGVVAMCVPATAEASTTLLKAAQKMIEARDKFSEKSAAGLDKLQKALPFISAAKAYQVAKANNGGTFDADYLALSVLFPGEGVEIKPGNIDDIKNTYNDVNSKSDEVKKAAEEAEEAAKEANKAKERAWRADCGDDPNYCMYERAKSKAGMNGSENPMYRSVDAWSFSVALKRAQAYYPRRLSIEKPDGSSVDAKANSELRKVFYRYASSEIAKGFVQETGDIFDAYFPHMPKNTEEMKSTSMYTEAIYPITESDGKRCMHAWSGCPSCSGVIGVGSIAEMDNSDFKTCDQCKFAASSLGKVAAASTAIDNGFEYHYNIVAKAAEDYKKAQEKSAPASNKVKSMTGGWLEKLKDLLKNAFNKRIYAKPPGAYGAISIVVNKSSTPVSSGFENTFVSTNKRLGVRVAFSGATLIEEDSSEGQTVLSSLLSGFKNKFEGVSGLGGAALSCWSKLLEVYSKGQDSLMSAIEEGLNSLPLMSASGLGTWASKKLSGLMQDLGLEPANIQALKPVLINTEYVATAGSKDSASSAVGRASVSFATKYLSIKQKALQIDDMSSQALKALSSSEEMDAFLNLQIAGNINGTVEIATIQPLGDWGPSFPITITLPKFSTSAMGGIVNGISSALQQIVDAVSGGKVWR